MHFSTLIPDVMFHYHRLFGSTVEEFYRFLPYMGMIDQDYLYTLLFPFPIEASLND